LKLLIDHNLSPKLARALQPLFPEHNIVPLCDRFRTDVTDIEWITELSAETGWATLTRDLRLRTRPHERKALDNSKIVFFFIGGAWKKYSVPETAARLIRLVPLMATQVQYRR
jgi:hypothetical protein